MSYSRINKEIFFENAVDILKEYFYPEEIQKLNESLNKILDKISDQNPFSKPEDYHKEMSLQLESACLDKMLAKVMDRKGDFIKLGLVYLTDSKHEEEFKKQTDYFFDALSVLKNNQDSIKVLFEDFGGKLEAKGILADKDHFYEHFFGFVSIGNLEKRFEACVAKYIVSPPPPPSPMLFRAPTDQMVDLKRQGERELYSYEAPGCRIS